MIQRNSGNYFTGLERAISNEKRIFQEISNLIENLEERSPREGKMILSQFDSLKKLIKKENERGLFFLGKIYVPAPMPKKAIHLKPREVEIPKEGEPREIRVKSEGFLESFIHGGVHSYKKIKLKDFEKDTIKRLKKRELKKAEKKEKKPNFYISLSNKVFSEVSARLIEKGRFKSISINLIKSNMEFLPKSYVSVILFTTLVSFMFSLLVFAFFVFFSLQLSFPFIAPSQGNILARMLSLSWILVAIPAFTFLMMYIYPALERGSIEGKIDQELPFAAINMAAIASSMIDPTKLFEIIISTREYPALEKEFGKIINGVNVLGYDLISVLRNRAFTSPSKNLAELLNGIATTINTGGDLPKFFDERAKSLLFEYNLEKEKSAKAAETFMDIYISVVIAAPMILMLLLIIMQISGLGLSLTTKMITLIMVLGVSLINVVFLVFLHIKQSGEA